MSKDIKSPGNGGGSSKLERFGDRNEEELSVLSRHTKVVVTGNNRTKSTLVGLQGVIKKSIGLGGWYRVKLANGNEVRLQRNALTVIEAQPTDGDDSDSENIKQKTEAASSLDISMDQAHKLSGSHSKTKKKASSRDSKAKVPMPTPQEGSTKVNLSKLDTSSLKRYWQHYNLYESSSITNPTREQLLDVVEKHFTSEEVDEMEVIAGFIEALNKEKKASK